MHAVGGQAPDLLQELVAADRPPGVRRQVAQQIDLALGQLLGRAVVAAQRAAGEVDHAAGEDDLAHLERALGGAAQHGVHARDHLGEGEGLDHVVVGEAQAAHALGLGAAGGEHDRRQGRTPGAQGAEQVEPVAAGEHAVEEDEIEGSAESGGLALAVGRGRESLEALEGERVHEHAPDRRVVLHHQDPAPGHGWGV